MRVILDMAVHLCSDTEHQNMAVFVYLPLEVE